MRERWQNTEDKPEMVGETVCPPTPRLPNEYYFRCGWILSISRAFGM